MNWRFNYTSWLIGAIFLLAIVSTAAGEVIYVDVDANGLNNGTNWADAYNYLQDGLMMASAGDEIWVAQGTYKPDDFVLSDRPNLGRKETFQLKNGVAIKGGYAGCGEPDPNARDIEAYETILSGDLDGNDVEVNDPCDLQTEPTRAENSYHLFYHPEGLNLDDTAILEGFTITGGNANGDTRPHYYYGGGMYNYLSSPTVTNCTFSQHSAFWGGGAMYNLDASPTVTDCTFIKNSSTCGGAISNYLSNAKLTNCQFIRNLAGIPDPEEICDIFPYGGGISNVYSNPTLISCTFSENSVTGCGGGMDNYHSNPTLIKCTFSANVASYVCNSNSGGAGMCSEWSSPTLTSCTFIRNSAEEYGGGMYNVIGSPTLTNCVFIGNLAPEGGGIFNRYGDTYLTLTKCKFAENSAESGGAIYNRYSAPPVINCTFTRNRASLNGGGVYNDGASPTLTNCTFSGNVSSESGGSICNIGGYSARCVLALANCTFNGNAAPNGNALAFDSWQHDRPSRFQADNCVFWDSGYEVWNNDNSHITINYSDVQGGWPGEGNIDADPCFASPGYWADANDPNTVVEPNDPNAFWVDGDEHLKSQAGRWEASTKMWEQDDVTSPCIDAGDPIIPIGLEPFPNGGRVNMGAYGGTVEASKSYFGEPVCEIIVAGDVNGDCIVNYLDFRLMSLHWLEDNNPSSQPPPPPPPPPGG